MLTYFWSCHCAVCADLFLKLTVLFVLTYLWSWLCCLCWPISEADCAVCADLFLKLTVLFVLTYLWSWLCCLCWPISEADCAVCADLSLKLTVLFVLTCLRSFLSLRPWHLMTLSPMSSSAYCQCCLRWPISEADSMLFVLTYLWSLPSVLFVLIHLGSCLSVFVVCAVLQAFLTTAQRGSPARTRPRSTCERPRACWARPAPSWPCPCTPATGPTCPPSLPTPPSLPPPPPTRWPRPLCWREGRSTTSAFRTSWSSASTGRLSAAWSHVSGRATCRATGVTWGLLPVPLRPPTTTIPAPLTFDIEAVWFCFVLGFFSRVFCLFVCFLLLFFFFGVFGWGGGELHKEGGRGGGGGDLRRRNAVEGQDRNTHTHRGSLEWRGREIQWYEASREKL